MVIKLKTPFLTKFYTTRAMPINLLNYHKENILVTLKGWLLATEKHWIRITDNLKPVKSKINETEWKVHIS